jgi:hypothetical protein
MLYSLDKFGIHELEEIHHCAGPAISDNLSSNEEIARVFSTHRIQYCDRQM